MISVLPGIITSSTRVTCVGDLIRGSKSKVDSFSLPDSGIPGAASCVRLTSTTPVNSISGDGVGNVVCSRNTIHKPQVFFSLLKNINHNHTPSIAVESHPLLSHTH